METVRAKNLETPAIFITSLNSAEDVIQRDFIMPPPFFFKFSMKESLDLDDVTLRENIRAFLDHYDVKKTTDPP